MITTAVRVLTLAALTLASAGALVATADVASAATNSTVRYGIAVKTPQSKTAPAGGTAAVGATVHRLAGKSVVVRGYALNAFRDGHRVAHARSIRLRPDTYRLSVTVAYRTYKTVTKRHKVSKRRPAVDLDNVRCRATAVSNYPESGDYFVDRAKCVSPKRPGQVVNETVVLAREDGPYRVGQIVHADYVHFRAYTHSGYRTGPVRVYSKTRYFTTSRQSLVIHQKAKPVQLDCTLTSRGTCIQGGQFCPQASYGQSGWDAEGRRYVCEGDTTHPHWYLP